MYFQISPCIFKCIFLWSLLLVATTAKGGSAKRGRNAASNSNPPPGLYGSVVQILLDGKLHCAGSIVRHQWVMTAAQCVLTNVQEGELVDRIYSTPRIKVKVGHPSQPHSVEMLNVTQVIVQQKYNIKRPALDIALLRVYPWVPFSANISAANFPPCQWKNLTDKPRLVTWESESSLKATEVTLIGDDECTKLDPEIDLNHETRFCSKEAQGQEGHCKGLPGSPLLVPFMSEIENDRDITFFTIGQLSPRRFGKCGDEKATQYIRTSHFVGWLHRRTSDCGNYVFSHLIDEKAKPKTK